MLNLVKPRRLEKGDTVATVSLSWGGAGDDCLRWRYEQGKERLEQIFGLKVVEMPHTLSGSNYLYRHPEKRAEDLMDAFRDDSIKAVVSCIGGSDSIRMLPYIDFRAIRNHPKIFTGYSDSTVTHYLCLKAGLSSFYGLSVLNDFAENVAMSDYTVEWIKRVLFRAKPVGTVPPSAEWTGQHLEWDVKNKNVARKFESNTGYELLQGSGTVRGKLIGGCLEVIEYLKGTSLFPPADAFDEAILFLENSELQSPVWLLEDDLRNFGTMSILSRINGIIFGKPRANRLYEDYKPVIQKVLAEFRREDMPVLYNASFGHNEPKCCLPFGALAEINSREKTFSILESGVV